MLSILRSNQWILLFRLLLLTLVLIQVSALPLCIRQNATTVQTVHITQTLAGPIVKTCVIILTPITGENGKPAVKEVETCTVAIPPGPGGACATSTSGCGTTTSLAATVTSIIPGTSISASGLPTTTINPGLMGSSTISSSMGTTSTPLTSSTLSTPLSSIGPGVVVNGLSTVTSTPLPTTITSSRASSTTTTINKSSSGIAAPDVASSAPRGTGTAASTSAFQLPGKTLSVLPIGLGVFAGISVIALIVVGLVTYERTKYRKAFRQRKLEESGGGIGYTV